MTEQRIEADIAIVGGGAGVAAALEAGDVGASVVGGRVAGGWAAHETSFGAGFVGTANRPD